MSRVLYSLAETPQPIRGRYWSAKIDEISLYPLIQTVAEVRLQCISVIVRHIVEFRVMKNMKSLNEQLCKRSVFFLPMLSIGEPGEQCTVVFALIFTELASECTCVEGGYCPHPLAGSSTVYAKTTMHCSPDFSMYRAKQDIWNFSVLPMYSDTTYCLH
jgi:hypothetical protein